VVVVSDVLDADGFLRASADGSINGRAGGFMEYVWQYFTQMFPKRKLCRSYPCRIVGFGMACVLGTFGQSNYSIWKPLFCEIGTHASLVS
jgi:hypothetical protein